MVSQATVNAKVNYGFSKAAAALGAACGWYRWPGLGSPVAPGGWRGAVNAAFQVPNTRFTVPAIHGKPLRWGLFDSTLIAPGDYLSDPNLGMFFVASTEPMRYPLMVACNTVLTLTRPTPAAAGASHYEGDTASDETVLGAGWPASCLNGTKGEKSDIGLPADTRSAWVAILLPPSFPVQILSGDVATTADPQPRRYTLSACELTALGWRITAELAIA
jgi:hypothetical protein